MNEKINIKIIDEKESVLDIIEIKEQKINNLENLKRIISSKIDLKNKIVEYYINGDFGNKNLIKNEDDFLFYKNYHFYIVKISNSFNEINDLVSNIIGFNSNIDKNVINNVKNSLKCWICLNGSLIEKPFFCPNQNCLKGVHENCIKKRGENEDNFKCICGNIYKIYDWKTNKLVNELSEFIIKKNSEQMDLISNLKDKIKEYEFNPEKCQKHSKDFLLHFCYDCHEAFCGTCYIKDKFNKHKNHRLIDYKIYNEINKIELENEDIIMNIKNIINEYINIINLLKSNKDYYIKCINNILNNIENSFDQLIKKSNNKIEEIKIKYNNINNLKEKINNFFSNLDRNNYNEIKNYEEIKNSFNFNNINKLNFNIEYELENLEKIKEMNYKISKSCNDIIDKCYIFNETKKNFRNKLYIGHIKNNLKESFGILYIKNSGKYKGEFKNDKMDGHGIYYFKDGSKYEGEFKNDHKEGKGIYYYKNGSKYEGEFKNDNFEGIGTFYHSNGNIEFGEFKNDKLEGRGIIFYLDGNMSMGKYKEDQKIGKHITLFSDGQHEIENNH